MMQNRKGAHGGDWREESLGYVRELLRMFLTLRKSRIGKVKSARRQCFGPGALEAASTSENGVYRYLGSTPRFSLDIDRFAR